MKLLNSILTVAITLTAFNSLAGVNDRNERRLSCSLYSHQASFVKYDLNNAKRFSQMNIGPIVKPSMQDNEKILGSMFVKRVELTKSLEKIALSITDSEKRVSILFKEYSFLAQQSSERNAPIIRKIKIELSDARVLDESLKKQQTAMSVALESLNKQIEKQKMLLSQTSVDDVKDSSVGIERKAYFSQRAADLEKELSKLQGLISQLCK